MLQMLIAQLVIQQQPNAELLEAVCIVHQALECAQCSTNSDCSNGQQCVNGSCTTASVATLANPTLLFHLQQLHLN